MTTRRQPRSQIGKVTTPDFAYSGTELDAFDEGRNYYRWLIERFRPWLGKHVVEVGAGIGTFAQHLLDLGEVESLVALEPGRNTFPALKQRFAADARVETVRAYIHQLPSIGSDSVIAVNVLEHIENDREFLRQCHRVTNARGNLLLYVPALPWIYGTLDVAFEHHRRYTMKSLRKVIEDSGWTVREMSYVNMPGVLAWFVAGRLLRKTSLGRIEVGIYDRWVVPLISRVEKLWSPPIGQSLVAIASKSSG